MKYHELGNPHHYPVNKRQWCKTICLFVIVCVLVLLFFNATHRYLDSNDITTRCIVEISDPILEHARIKNASAELTPAAAPVSTTTTTTTTTKRPKLIKQPRLPRVLNINQIKKKIAIINREEVVINQDYFGPVQNISMVIVVQVHDRLPYLKYLISSLREARDIENALVIFSHDYFDENINIFIESIDFCRVMQIFYPYSLQLYPNEFPGHDSRDCPPELPRSEAVAKACANAFYGDKDGKYRNPKLTQVKHHWWWKANRVFDLDVIREYDGPIIFLEEDLYVVEDFIPAMKLLHAATKESCSACKILSLAANEDAVNLHRADFRWAGQATITSHFSNMGLSFTRQTWGEMVDCASVFCKFDDCNWDFSLQNTFTTCMENTAAVNLNSPRVLHLGTCGVHFTSDNCNADGKFAEVQNLVKMNRNLLYPTKINLIDRNYHSRSFAHYGGWGDPRDHALCLGMTTK